MTSPVYSSARCGIPLVKSRSWQQQRPQRQPRPRDAASPWTPSRPDCTWNQIFKWDLKPLEQFFVRSWLNSRWPSCLDDGKIESEKIIIKDLMKESSKQDWIVPSIQYLHMAVLVSASNWRLAFPNSFSPDPVYPDPVFPDSVCPNSAFSETFALR